jgi:hypothetical protein
MCGLEKIVAYIEEKKRELSILENQICEGNGKVQFSHSSKQALKMKNRLDRAATKALRERDETF